jgi:hypothetical protein
MPPLRDFLPNVSFVALLAGIPTVKIPAAALAFSHRAA